MVAEVGEVWRAGRASEAEKLLLRRVHSGNIEQEDENLLSSVVYGSHRPRARKISTIPNATPPIGKLPPFSKIVVTLEPIM